jgi:hypothetical protein
MILCFQVFCDSAKKAKVESDFGLASGGLLHGKNEVEIELEQTAEFLKVSQHNTVFSFTVSKQIQILS